MDEETLNYEEAMKQLENIADELEKGNLTLDESVAKFEEGMNLSKKCANLLDEAEKKITILVQTNENEVKEEDFVPKAE